MTISRSFLSGLAAVALAAFAAGGPEDMAPAHRFVKRADAETHKLRATVSRVMLTADETNGRYSIVDEEFPPDMQSFPHKHAYHSETFLVVSGRMEWKVGGETQILGPGDLVYIPPDTPHSTSVVGDEVAHVIMIYEPAGYELNLRRRANLTPEQRSDPENRRRMMELSDVVPLSSAGRDF